MASNGIPIPGRLRSPAAIPFLTLAAGLVVGLLASPTIGWLKREKPQPPAWKPTPTAKVMIQGVLIADEAANATLEALIKGWDATSYSVGEVVIPKILLGGSVVGAQLKDGSSALSARVQEGSAVLGAQIQEGSAALGARLQNGSAALGAKTAAGGAQLGAALSRTGAAIRKDLSERGPQLAKASAKINEVAQGTSKQLDAKLGALRAQLQENSAVAVARFAALRGASQEATPSPPVESSGNNSLPLLLIFVLGATCGAAVYVKYAGVPPTPQWLIDFTETKKRIFRRVVSFSRREPPSVVS